MFLTKNFLSCLFVTFAIDKHFEYFLYYQCQIISGVTNDRIILQRGSQFFKLSLFLDLSFFGESLTSSNLLSMSTTVDSILIKFGAFIVLFVRIQRFFDFNLWIKMNVNLAKLTIPLCSSY